MPTPPPITDDQLLALNMTVLRQGGALQNCIVHRTPECHARGGYFIGYPLPTGGWPAAGAHICGDCAMTLRRPTGGTDA